MPEGSGLSDRDKTALHQITDAISQTERRAMEAERDTIDRYVAAWLSGRVGETFDTRITGVQGFGFFATIEKLGGDGLVPVSMLGSERFFYDEAARTLDSEHGRVSYSVGQRLDLRLMEANPVSGALRFELPDAPEGGFRNRPPRRDGVKKAGKHAVGKRGRPGNIRHQGKRR
jgi:ribonuclease R